MTRPSARGTARMARAPVPSPRKPVAVDAPLRSKNTPMRPQARQALRLEQKRGRLLLLHGRDNHGAQVRIHIVRRHDHTGPRLLDFAADGGVELSEPDLPGLHHHARSASPAFATSGHTSASSPCSASRRASSAQPSRGLRCSGRSFDHTVAHLQVSQPSSPTWARIGFGINTPCELPILRIATSMLRLPTTRLAQWQHGAALPVTRALRDEATCRPFSSDVLGCSSRFCVREPAAGAVGQGSFERPTRLEARTYLPV